jgi:hypothetical protein
MGSSLIVLNYVDMRVLKNEFSMRTRHRIQISRVRKVKKMQKERKKSSFCPGDYKEMSSILADQ